MLRAEQLAKSTHRTNIAVKPVLPPVASKEALDTKLLKGICCGIKYLPTEYTLNKCQVGKFQKKPFLLLRNILI